ncbi:MAG: hypothetical protein RBR67_08985 [Desulfobacterium sp.]|nr:hypothetical protein [Desulfobacterium sp.]
MVQSNKAKNWKILYRLQPDHGALLTKDAGSANLGVYTQEIPLLTSCAMDAVAGAFPNS